MMKKADVMADLISLEAALANVTYEIEFYEKQLRTLSGQVSYSTIELTLSERTTVSSVAPPKDGTFGERLKETFLTAIRNFVTGMERLLLGIVDASPYLVLIALLGGAITWIVVGSRKRRKRG